MLGKDTSWQLWSLRGEAGAEFGCLLFIYELVLQALCPFLRALEPRLKCCILLKPFLESLRQEGPSCLFPCITSFVPFTFGTRRRWP